MISMMAMNATEIQAQGVVPAQKGEKTFTLEDLNFGGNNYRNMVAKNRWCTWWGNELVRQDVDACYLVNKTTGKETKLFGINDINQWIAPTKDIKVRALYNAQFPFAGKSIVMVSNGSKTYTIDFKKHKLLSEMEFADGENLLEANAQQNAFAYLKGSNLYVRYLRRNQQCHDKREEISRFPDLNRMAAAKSFMVRVFTAMSSASARVPSGVLTANCSPSIAWTRAW